MARLTIIFLSIFLVLYTSAVAQTKPTETIKEKIELINVWTATLDTLNPFHEGDWDIIDSLNQLVERNLLKLLNEKNIVNYPVDSLLHLRSAKSADNKIIVFSFYENTGGSYRSNVNTIYYRLPDGEPKAEMLKFCNDIKDHGEDNYGGTMSNIFSLKGKNKTKYLLCGEGIGCNTCKFDYVVLLSLGPDSLQTDFCFLLDYRLGDGEVKYDSKKQIISYEYTHDMDDNVYGNDCSEGQKTPDNKCRYSARYKFNGETFVRTKT
jgi:hypothetical protein